MRPMRRLRAVWGARIRKAREAAGLSQWEFAKALDVNQSAASRWESGLASPEDWRRPIIAALLGVDANELFSYDDDGNGGEGAAA